MRAVRPATWLTSAFALSERAQRATTRRWPDRSPTSCSGFGHLPRPSKLAIHTVANLYAISSCALRPRHVANGRKPDTPGVEPAWTFQRGSERLELQRRETDRGIVLLIRGDGAPRSYTFRQISALMNFQNDMEQFLLRSGWSLETFLPDHRTGKDRRAFPRVEPDRRRWWTDGRGALPFPRNA